MQEHSTGHNHALAALGDRWRLVHKKLQRRGRESPHCKSEGNSDWSTGDFLKPHPRFSVALRVAGLPPLVPSFLEVAGTRFRGALFCLSLSAFVRADSNT